MAVTTIMTYTGDGATNAWSISYDYLKKTHVKMYLDGVEDTTFTWLTDSSVAATSTPGSGVTITIKRETPRDVLDTVIPASGTIRGADLNNQAYQALYVAEEGYDALVNVLSLDTTDDTWDANSKIIKNVATPTASHHAARKDYVDAVAGSATAAAASAAAAASSASDASSSATSASSSASAAASSASAASTSATNALASENAAETAETNAAASAAAAATSETNAATSETNAASSASAAAASEAQAISSESAAAASATAAQTAETNAAASYDAFDDRYLGDKASEPTVDNDGAALLTGAMYWDTGSNSLHWYNGGSWEDPVSDADTAKTAAETAQTAAETAETNAASSASAASTSETNAASSASAASTSATNAATSETNAASSASAAATSATNAATSETNAAASWDAFDDTYLGAKSSDPTLDNDGDALTDGTMYWNTSSTRLRIYNSGAWENAAEPISSGVTYTGTPADNQLAIWTTAGTVEGDSAVTWNGTQLEVSGSIRSTGGTLFINRDGDVADAVGILSSDAGENAFWYYREANSNRWGIGRDVSNNFDLNRYNSSGVYQEAAVQVSFTDSAVTLAGALEVGTDLDLTDGTARLTIGAGGTATPNAAMDALVIDSGSAGNNGLNIITDSGSTGYVGFGDAADSFVAGLGYAHTGDTLSIYAGNAAQMTLTGSLVTMNQDLTVNGQVVLDNGASTGQLSIGDGTQTQEQRLRLDVPTRQMDVVMSSDGNSWGFYDRTAATWRLQQTTSSTIFNGDVDLGSNDLYAQDVIIDSTTGRLYLDGGGDTYIYESSADVMSFYVGGVRPMAFNGLATYLYGSALPINSNQDLGTQTYPWDEIHGNALFAGVDDTTAGLVHVYGSAVGAGGGIRLYNAGDEDTTYNYFQLRMDSGGVFQMDMNTGGDMLFYSVSAGEINVQSNTLSDVAQVEFVATANNLINLGSSSYIGVSGADPWWVVDASDYFLFDQSANSFRFVAGGTRNFDIRPTYVECPVGLLYVGDDDTTQGAVYLYGGATGAGGQARFYNNAAIDATTAEYYMVGADSNGNFLMCSQDGTTKVYWNEAEEHVEVVGHYYHQRPNENLQTISENITVSNNAYMAGELTIADTYTVTISSGARLVII